MSAQREMTLQEWVDKLPGIHSAHKEFDSLQDTIAQQAERIAELEQQRQQWLDADLCGMVVRDQERTITEQAALIDKCEKDAARYQYFRSSAAAAMYLNSTDEKLDFAIDAAIAAQKGGAA